MIKLTELNVWEKLSSPYGNSSEIPGLLARLSDKLDKVIADEIVWEYIYHQGSIYENTLATLPHLLNIIEKSDDLGFNLDLISSLGVVYIYLDGYSSIKDIFQSSTLSTDEKNRIQKTFLDSLVQFKKLVRHFLLKAKILDEESKRFYLIACLVSEKKHSEAEVFKTFCWNDEYIFVCPNCGKETFLWNEDNVLNAYENDPVSNKNQTKLEIKLNHNKVNIEFIEQLVYQIDIESLKPLMKYFNGDLNCHYCNEKSIVFDGVINSICNN